MENAIVDPIVHLPRDVWCHACNKYGIARIDTDTGDYMCENPDCRSVFVETTGQGIESFLGTEASANPAIHTDTLGGMGSQRQGPSPVRPVDATTSRRMTAMTAMTATTGATAATGTTATGTRAESSSSNASGNSLTQTAHVSTSTSSQHERSHVERTSNELLQQILNRVLGLGIQVRPQVHSTLLDVMQQAAEESGRPIGMVVRQAVSAEDLEMLSTSLANGTLRSGLTQGSVGVTLSAQGGGLLGQITGNEGTGNRGRSGVGLGSGSSADSPAGRLESLLGSGSFEDLMHYILMNESSYSATPAANEIIDQLPRINIASHNIDSHGLGDCSIAQEAFVIGDVVVTLPCEHSFREESIVRWLKMHDTCPVCRVQLQRQSADTNTNTQT
jgi:hypothetical protein